MELTARYHDGHVALVRDVVCRLDGTGSAQEIVITDLASRDELDRWKAADIYPIHARKYELRIGAEGRPAGARLIVSGFEPTRAAHAMLPALARRHRQERGRQYRALGLATAALVSVVLAYVYGVPLLAGSIVDVVPPDWERRLGDTVVAQIEAALKPEAGFEVCDPDPNSLANRAIARFAARAVEGSGTPFVPDIKVIRTSIPNAFALPGGHSFYFSALLDQTESPDEFAGVMAHELGHVVHRHGMEQLISTSATGLLIGFILGDMTGLSVAGGVGAALIDSRFSREAEREADAYAAATARRLGFQPVGLVNLLERVATDDEMTRALALLSTHPLTSERRAALEALTIPATASVPAFTAAEWAAIKSMCGGPQAPAAGAAGPDRLKNG
ncbi:MAG TPA: M48 family metallopeptidase [Alphaproteobacteria bacterium]|nr:M48 family metallopeptidase [Alphaproteobacteria bacterium]